MARNKQGNLLSYFKIEEKSKTDLRNRTIKDEFESSQCDDNPLPTKRRRQFSTIDSDCSSGSDPEAIRSNQDSDEELLRPRKRAGTRRRNVGNVLFMDNREARAEAKEDAYDSGSDINDFIVDDEESEDENTESQDMTTDNEAVQAVGDEGNASDEVEHYDSGMKTSKVTHGSSFLKISDSDTDSETSDRDKIMTPGRKKLRTPSSVSTRRRVLSDGDHTPPVEGSEDEAPAEMPIKRSVRKKRLRRIRIIPDSQEVDDEHCNSSKDHVSSEKSDSDDSEDDVDDFIVSDTEEVVGEDGQKPLFYPDEERAIASLNIREAWLVVIECMILRCTNPNFFQSTDFLNNTGLKRAHCKAFDTLNALISDTRSNAWSVVFRKLLEYPEMRHHKKFQNGREQCLACNKSNRFASCKVAFSGSKYDLTTLQDLAEEETIPSYKERSVNIGKYCYERATSYHELLHFRKQLLQSCSDKIKRLKLEDAADEVVIKKILKEDEWLDLQLKSLTTLCSSAQRIIQKRSMINETEAVLMLK